MFIRLLLDTNFLILPLKLGKNIKAQLDEIIGYNYKIITLEDSLRELEAVAPRFSSNIHESIIQLYAVWPEIDVIRVENAANKTVDDKILEYAVKYRCLVATNDVALRRRLKKMRVPTIYLRQRGHLEIDESIPLIGLLTE